MPAPILKAESRFIAVFTCVFLFALPSAAQRPGAIGGYHDHASLTSTLRSLAEQQPDLVRLSSLARSAEGRDVWLLEIGADGDVPRDERPALLVAANFEGTRLAGSELALGIVEELVSRRGDDPAVTERLRNSVVYVIPRANPDGAERMFASLPAPNDANSRPVDDDNDGRTNEDGPEDLNGDGYITVMRAADPDGGLMVDSSDSRVLRKANAAKGEAAAYTVYWEGIDNDGDGFINEDWPGGVNLSRNFQHEYPYYERGAGPHMVSEPESRAIMDFAIARRNIATVLVFDGHDNLVTAPNDRGELAPAKPVGLFEYAASSLDDSRTVGMFAAPRRGFGFGGFGGGGGGDAEEGRSQGRRPETTVNEDDSEYFTAVSERYRELTGIEELASTSATGGAFFEYGYYQFGVPSFSSPGWGYETMAEPDSAAGDADADDAGDAGRPARGRAPSGARSGRDGADSESVDRKLLSWMDANGVDGFVEWMPYDHPTLGAVEIGGFKPYEPHNPPIEILDGLAPKQADFVLYLASLFARVQIADVDVTDHGGGVFRIKAVVENAGYLPTSTAHGVVSRSVRPTMVQLEVDPDAILSGDEKTSFFQLLDGSGRRTEFEWIISGRRDDTVQLRVVSQKGGSDTADVSLR